MIALTIDETGMAKDAAAQARASRAASSPSPATRHGLPRHDLLIDPLTFTICTGNEDDRRLGIETLEAIAAIAAEFPEIQIILGLSNISFGLNPAARHVLNSVFLDHAQQARPDRRDRALLQDHAAAQDRARGGARSPRT